MPPTDPRYLGATEAEITFDWLVVQFHARAEQRAIYDVAEKATGRPVYDTGRRNVEKKNAIALREVWERTGMAARCERFEIAWRKLLEQEKQPSRTLKVRGADRQRRRS